MCVLCAKIRRMSIGDALILIGEKMEDAKADRKHLEEVLDGLLMESMGEDADEDEELAAEWERYRREN